jgi:N-acetylmuramic acid 6-phosphate etherase
MVNMHATNEKLVERGIRILQIATGRDRAAAESVLRESGMNVSLALVMLNSGLAKREAARRLTRAGNNVRKALQGS